MQRTVVALLGLVLLVAPAIPTMASSHDGAQGDDGDDADEESRFEGDHLAFTIDRELPGVRNFTLARSDALVFTSIQLPGTLDQDDVEMDDERVRLETEDAELRIEDTAELEIRLDADEDPITLNVAPDVAVSENRSDDGIRYRLTPSSGPSLVLFAEEGQRPASGTIELSGTAFTHADGSANRTGDRSSDRGNASDPGEGRENRTTEDRDTEESDDEMPSDRDDDAPDQRQKRRAVSNGPYRVGPVTFRLTDDTLRDLTIRDEGLLTALSIPGLRPADQERRGNELRIRADDARLGIRADGGMLLRAEADDTITARLDEDVEVRLGEDAAFLRVGSLVVVAEGDDLTVEDGVLRADEELRLSVRAQERPEGPVWRAERTSYASAQLPVVFQGRYLSFTLDERGVTNLSVHGTPLANVSAAQVQPTEIERTGARFSAEGDAFELRAIDAPAAQLRVEADGLATELPERTQLSNGAEIHVRIEDDELRLRVVPPRDVLANETMVRHRPADVPVEPAPGPAPGLQARTNGSSLGVTSSDPSTVHASFSGQLNETVGNVSLELGLVRAMLIEDTNANGRVDVGEPALAERPLVNGSTRVDGDELVSTFPLWSGNLSVAIEPGQETAKVTYTVQNLSAPPGTLFVLETRVSAPPGASLQPTDTGVSVRNGSMIANYSAAGPVTVDGSSAWADRSIFVDSNDTVRVLLAYPAGDDIVHDPTLAIQSVPGAEVVSRLAASPWAIAAGAVLAGGLVAVTAWHRRRGPRP